MNVKLSLLKQNINLDNKKNNDVIYDNFFCGFVKLFPYSVVIATISTSCG